MIQLKDVSYVRLGSPDLESAETFATSCLGLQVAERGKKALYLRSDDRSHTLCYSESDPADQTVGFEVEDEASLQEAATTLETLGHHVHVGSADEVAQRKGRSVIGFRDPTGNHTELVVRAVEFLHVGREARWHGVAEQIDSTIQRLSARH